MADMTHVDSDQGSIRATVDCLDDKGVDSAIEQVLSYDVVCRQDGTSEVVSFAGS